MRFNVTAHVLIVRTTATEAYALKSANSPTREVKAPPISLREIARAAEVIMVPVDDGPGRLIRLYDEKRLMWAHEEDLEEYGEAVS